MCGQNWFKDNFECLVHVLRTKADRSILETEIIVKGVRARDTGTMSSRDR